MLYFSQFQVAADRSNPAPLSHQPIANRPFPAPSPTPAQQHPHPRPAQGLGPAPQPSQGRRQRPGTRGAPPAGPGSAAPEGRPAEPERGAGGGSRGPSSPAGGSSMAKAAMSARRAGKRRRRWLCRALSNRTELPAAVTSDPPITRWDKAGRAERRHGGRVSGPGIGLCRPVPSGLPGKRSLRDGRVANGAEGIAVAVTKGRSWAAPAGWELGTASLPCLPRGKGVRQCPGCRRPPGQGSELLPRGYGGQ